MSAGLRILIVDDEKAVRTALGRLLGTRGEWVVVGEAADGAEAVGKAKELKPDVIIMDVTLPELNGLAATPEIKKVLPSAEILIFTQHESSQMIREARKAGASGYLKVSSELAGNRRRGDQTTQAVLRGQESVASPVIYFQ
jgi:DNA-binding NarL/FixJ family response regulator